MSLNVGSLDQSRQLLKVDTLEVDTIDEKTADQGVNIDGLILKDEGINFFDVDIRISSYATGIHIRNMAETVYTNVMLGKISVLSRIVANEILEYTEDNGITIDGVLVKDNNIGLIDTKITTHKALVSDHHAKYLDGQVDTIVATHKALVNDHHTKYVLTDNLTSGEITQLQAIGSSVIDATIWALLAKLSTGANKLQIGNVLIQWGISDNVTSGNVTVTYPIAYTSMPAVTTISDIDNTLTVRLYVQHISEITLNNFIIQARYAVDSGAGATDIFDMAGMTVPWISIGINTA